MELRKGMINLRYQERQQAILDREIIIRTFGIDDNKY